MFSLKPKTIHGKVLFGYSVIIVLSFFVFVLALFEFGISIQANEATASIFAERRALDGLFAALVVLDGEVERFDPALYPVDSGERLQRSVQSLRSAMTEMSTAASLPETKARVGILRESVELLANSALLLPNALFDEIPDKRAVILASSRNVRAVASAVSGTTGAELKRGFENEHVIMTYAWDLLLMVGGVLFLLGIFLAAKGSSLVANPVRHLKDMATRIAKGEYDTRAVLDGNDEIAELAYAFNAMADRMTHYNQELEREVAARTKDLNEKLEILNKLNHDLDQSASLLIRRDLELTRANERLRELDRLKSEFLSVAAHQLRTPLSAVKWVFSLVLEGRMGDLNAEQKNFLEKGKESNERMVRLVDDMLAVTRIESGRTEYSFSRVSVKEFIQNLIPDFSATATERGVRLDVRADITESTDAMLDKEKIRFVFDNLIDNAIKYTPAGGVVSIALRKEGKYITIDITDTGIGIPEAEQKNIFAKFFRATNAVKIVTDGNGLGLFVVKTIVERHGGTVTFVSQTGKGTTFTVQIPIAVGEGEATDPNPVSGSFRTPLSGVPV